MNIKYYTNTKNLQLILISIIVSFFIIQSASASIITSSASPDKIFKCQASTISATFTNGGITAVNAIITSDKPVQPGWQSGSNVPIMESTNVTMTWNGTSWVGIFGNNANLLWGTRSISYRVVNGGTNTYLSTTDVLVYSDVCTGTGMTSYKNVSTGLPMNYTNSLLQGDTSLVDWVLLPYVDTMGVLFFFIIICLVVFLTWMKSHNPISTILVGMLMIVLVSDQNYIPVEYQGAVKIILAIMITSLLVYIFVKRK